MLKTLFQPIHSVRLPPPGSFNNQTVLITGSNTGLGLEAVRHAVSLGASKIIMGVRSVEKGERTREDILSRTSTGKSTKTDIEVWKLDMSSFQSVMSFVHRMKAYVSQPGKRLDTAILNAGLASGIWKLSPDGWEMQIQVNGLSTALLGLELLPILISSASSSPSIPHLVIVASDIHQVAQFPQRSAPHILQALNNEEQWRELQAKSPVERYAVSKLFNQWTNIEISKLVPVDSQTGQPKVIVTSVTPGFCKSELLSREEGAPWLLKAIQMVSARTPADGAKTIVDAAVRQDGHGKWLENQKLTDPGPIVSSPEGQKIQQKAWKEILDVLKKVDPDLTLDFS
ncbi:short-chain dehydrogenase, putative [Talaromyces stipitatus ATCC 10500]|uniref:Short-chain dehydrogenase, putative n=1 Tax=Talaromyces stipitatus (strain ATCC 10500 / CBS 375.48 / QM 6759 / NRRL 1006) TaxID=441959 RepID=B8LVR3_TALSN|nr:short-chain dehydrogenase, putative [Talaromyces stipitatus ATCC 10500]EED24193.1 short-chain dehydrogenase, putative [Talaromyces stipitatus ATCC 10500]